MIVTEGLKFLDVDPHRIRKMWEYFKLDPLFRPHSGTYTSVNILLKNGRIILAWHSGKGALKGYRGRVKNMRALADKARRKEKVFRAVVAETSAVARFTADREQLVLSDDDYFSNVMAQAKLLKDKYGDKIAASPEFFELEGKYYGIVDNILKKLKDGIYVLAVMRGKKIAADVIVGLKGHHIDLVSTLDSIVPLGWNAVPGAADGFDKARRLVEKKWGKVESVAVIDEKDLKHFSGDKDVFASFDGLKRLKKIKFY